jgi:hypothetical protein
MKLKKVTENQKSRRLLECIGTDHLKRVTGGGESRGHLVADEPSVTSTARRSQMFDML